LDTKSPRCPICGGRKTPGLATFTADLGFGVVVVRKVDATVCDQCGEQWVAPDIARRLEGIVESARHERRQVEILDLAVST
jgi:YgiT-type zinc finger domain-containing protein